MIPKHVATKSGGKETRICVGVDAFERWRAESEIQD